ncbi:MAG: sulfatase-like hydrolase/transferase [Bacteroidales bacterium]|nr:sulfatase-like hydrolase/transferase [Bacteroidales bacterium]MCF8389171.1 sulfatase-like hydrolase/transferase [Bacteroidales bacterium]
MRKNIYRKVVISIISSCYMVTLSSQEKPNIILFLIDDADKYQFGCYGGPVYTPSIDQLAEEGMMFHNAYVNSTVCSPSRYSLTTGRYPGRSSYSGYLDNYPVGSQGHPEFNVGLEQDYLNIGHMLQTVGYKTGWVGKFHLQGDNSLQRGLTTSEKTFLKNADPNDPKATELFRKEEQAYRDYIVNKGFSWAKHIYEGNLKDPFKHHNLEWTIEAALEFIDSSAEAPFYLHFNTTLLHGPDGEWEKDMGFPQYTGEGLADGKYEADMPDRSTVIDRIETNGYNLKENPAGITWLDDGIRAVMNKLDELGIADNTIFVLLPDHGSANKASLFSQHGTNVPFIIRYPEKITAGTESSSLIQGIDLIPTFYEYAGVELPAGYQLDGASLSPIFNNPKEKIHESLYFELGCARAVMTENYKYVALRYTVDRINKILNIPEDDLKEKLIQELIYLDGHIGISQRGIIYSPEYLSPDQLYDISVDPEEKVNLAANPNYQEKLEEMKVVLTEYLSSFQNRPFGEFIPGPNATAPHPKVLEYIRNIQYALKNGAELKQGVLTCEGNCVIADETTDANIEAVRNNSDASARIFQDPDCIKVEHLDEISELKIYNVLGREVSSHSCNNNKTLVLNKTQYLPGTYFFTLRSDKNEEGYTEIVIIY